MRPNALAVPVFLASSVCVGIHLPPANEASLFEEGSPLEFESKRHGHDLADGKAYAQVLADETAFLDLARQRQGMQHVGHRGASTKRSHRAGASEEPRAASTRESPRAGRKHHHSRDAADEAADEAGGGHQLKKRRQTGYDGDTGVVYIPKKEKAERRQKEKKLKLVDVDVPEEDGNVESSDGAEDGEGGSDGAAQDRSHLEHDFEAMLPKWAPLSLGMVSKAWHSVPPAASNENGKAAPAEAIRMGSGGVSLTTEKPLPVAAGGGFEVEWMRYLPNIPIPRARKAPWACTTKQCKVARVIMSTVLVISVLAFACFLNCVYDCVRK